MSATATTMMAPATTIRGVTGSAAKSQPRRTATTGFT
jgi:hypothetical protein